MSVAAAAPNAFSYTDSGQRQFFTLTADGRASFVRIGSDGAPGEQRNLDRAVSFERRRLGEVNTPVFEMISAGGGRVFAKEKDSANFYIAVMDRMFLLNDGSGFVPSLYWKLDPEQGEPDAHSQDLLLPVPTQNFHHPAAVRFRFFRFVLSLPFPTMMVVNLDEHFQYWHLLDPRPLFGDKGIALPSGSDFPPRTTVIEYRQPDGTEVAIEGYQPYHVLDIGVGHEHWHEQASSIYGGEMDSLDGPGFPPVLIERDVYRFFNGPVDDQGGFIDGTANYYVLAQLVPNGKLTAKPKPGDYGLLWIDEQSAFSERWRLVHPDDCRFSPGSVPSSLVQYLFATPWYYTFAFDRTKFFCPFRAAHIGPFSRMAVNRQVIVVNGFDPELDRHVLYSINFSYGTCDRTWRWRELPIPETAANAAPPFELLGLREDMTIYLVSSSKGRRAVWFQRYLPADQTHRPDGSALRLPASQIVNRPTTFAELNALVTRALNPPLFSEVPNGPKPTERFEHPWQTLPLETWNQMHIRFPFFGCLQTAVSWRRQYYLVKLDDPGEAIFDTALEETSGALFIRKATLDWDTASQVFSDQSAVTQIIQDVNQVRELLAGLVQLLRQIEEGIHGLENTLDQAWQDATQALTALLNQIASTARAAVRAQVLNAAITTASQVLDGIWPMDILSPPDLRAVVAGLAVAVDGLIGGIFDPVWNAIAAAAGLAASILQEIQGLSLSGNLEQQVSQMVLGRIRAAAEQVFGGSAPRIAPAFTVNINLFGAQVDYEFDLPSIEVPISALGDAVTAALGALSWFQQGVASLTGTVRDALTAAAQLAAQQAQRAAIAAQIAVHNGDQQLYAGLTSAIQQVMQSSSLTRAIHKRPLFNSRFLLELRDRRPAGYILVHHDKRDDDLLAFNDLDRHGGGGVPVVLQQAGSSGGSFSGVLAKWRTAIEPPVVTSVQVILRRNSDGQASSVLIRFRSPKTGTDLAENIWKVNLGALPDPSLLSVLRDSNFAQEGESDSFVHIWDISGDADLRDKAVRFCTPEGREVYGTCVWFESILGQVSPPDSLEFRDETRSPLS